MFAARDGVEALNLLARDPRPVHLLLTDVIMPKMSGRELASRFRLLLPDVRVLYMTGYASDAIVHQACSNRASKCYRSFTRRWR